MQHMYTMLHKIRIENMITKIADFEIFYHGTSDTLLGSIKSSGLKKPYLTDLFAKAEYYAGEAVDEFGGSPIILEVIIPDKSKIIVDYNELDEPVIVDDMKYKNVNKEIQKQYNLYIKNNPDSYDKKYKTILINPSDYWFSLNIVNSVRYNDIIPSNYIKKIW